MAFSQYHQTTEKQLLLLAMKCSHPYRPRRVHAYLHGIEPSTTSNQASNILSTLYRCSKDKEGQTTPSYPYFSSRFQIQESVFHRLQNTGADCPLFPPRGRLSVGLAAGHNVIENGNAECRGRRNKKKRKHRRKQLSDNNTTLAVQCTLQNFGYETSTASYSRARSHAVSICLFLS